MSYQDSSTYSPVLQLATLESGSAERGISSQIAHEDGPGTSHKFRCRLDATGQRIPAEELNAARRYEHVRIGQQIVHAVVSRLKKKCAKRYWALAGLVVLLIVAAIAAGPIMSRVEQPKYKITTSEGLTEIRSYRTMIVAEADVQGKREAAIKEGFRLIAAYIFGANKPNAKIAMTAPVEQHKLKTVAEPMLRHGHCPISAETRSCSSLSNLRSGTDRPIARPAAMVIWPFARWSLSFGLRPRLGADQV